MHTHAHIHKIIEMYPISSLLPQTCDEQTLAVPKILELKYNFDIIRVKSKKKIERQVALKILSGSLSHPFISRSVANGKKKLLELKLSLVSKVFFQIKRIKLST